MIEHVRVTAPLTLTIAGVGDTISHLSLRGNQKYYTVTVALAARIELELTHNNTDEIHIEYYVEDDPVITWTGKVKDYDFTAPWAILLAACAYYGLTGLDAIIRIPLQNHGLGELETLALCAIQGCTELSGRRSMSMNQLVDVICALIRVIQPYIHIGNIFGSIRGGVRFWDWTTSLSSSRSIRVLPSDSYDELKDRIVLASPSTPIPPKHPRSFVNGCLKSGAISRLSYMNELLPDAVDAIRTGSWIPGLDYIRLEQIEVNNIDDQRVKGFEALEKAPSVNRGGFGIMNYGQRGCWFFSNDPDDAANVKDEWEARGAQIIDVKFTDEGLR
jgi:hypothetical protein